MVSELWITKLRKRCHFDVEEESQIFTSFSWGSHQYTACRSSCTHSSRDSLRCLRIHRVPTFIFYTLHFLVPDSQLKKACQIFTTLPQSAQSQILVMIMPMAGYPAQRGEDGVSRVGPISTCFTYISATHSWLLRKRLRDLLISQANWHSWIHYPHTRFLFALKCSLPVTSYFIWSERSEFFFGLRMQLKQYLGYRHFYCFS